MPATKGLTAEVAVAAFEEHGSVTAAAKALGVARSSLRHHLRKSGVDKKPMVSGQVAPTRFEQRPLPPEGEVKRYLCTSAQNNTHVHPPTWQNMLALSAYYEAEILCASFTYNQNAYGQLSVKRGTANEKEKVLWYAPEIDTFLDASDRTIQLAPGLVWCGSMNILPTAADPLSGFETYTGRASGIFPHAKLAMRSVPSSKYDATKFNYTTGTVTQLNYIQKTAGLKAEHHHHYGVSSGQRLSDY